MVERVGIEAIENYGIADVASPQIEAFSSVELRALVEKPAPEDAPSDLEVLGRYILPAKVLDLIAETGAGVGGEIQLTDALDTLIEMDGLNAFETDAATYDCGKKQGFLGANLAVGMRDVNLKKYVRELLASIEMDYSN
jgi:UTP--glucose-1-phosphate uridylyltransferase